MTSSDEPRADTTGVRERILHAARREFAELGREGASVRVIGERAGVTAAMINYYFGGKDALYEAVVAEAQAGLRTRLLRALDGQGAATDQPGLVAGAYFDFLAEDRTLQRLFLREVQGGGDRARELGARFVRPLRALLAERFGDDDVVVQAAISLFGAVAGYFLYEPLLPELLDEDPLSPGALARRRRHVVALAGLLVASTEGALAPKRAKHATRATRATPNKPGRKDGGSTYRRTNRAKENTP